MLEVMVAKVDLSRAYESFDPSTISNVLSCCGVPSAIMRTMVAGTVSRHRAPSLFSEPLDGVELL